MYDAFTMRYTEGGQMALKATKLLRDATFVARRGDAARARDLAREAAAHAEQRRQPNLLSAAADVWEHAGGEPDVAARWREAARAIRAYRRAVGERVNR